MSSPVTASSRTPGPDPRAGSDATPSGVPIVLDDVVKTFPGQDRAAVDHISLELPAGCTTVFVGPSGCGKTTTMRMINRLIEPSSGLITIDGEDNRSLDPDELRRTIGYAIQASGLFPHMTVAANVATVPKLLKWKKSRISARVDEMLDLVGLDPAQFRDRHPRQLSGGQQQRVGVARALAADPPVLLMDEPFGAVDPITRATLQDELVRLQAELHKTIVFVTHDFNEAVKLGDRIAVLGPGSRVLQYDSPDAILSHPADDTVSGFIGEDASLKRLTLLRVHDIRLGELTTAREDDAPSSVAEALSRAEHEWALVLDDDGRPARWFSPRLLRGRTDLRSGGQPAQGTVTESATLQEALDTMLSAASAMTAVTDRSGVYRGGLTIGDLVNALRVQDAEHEADAHEPEPR